MTQILVNVGHFAAMSNITVKAAIAALENTLQVSVADEKQLSEQEAPETVVAVIDLDNKSMEIGDSVENMPETHRFKVVFATTDLYDLRIEDLPPCICVEHEGLKIELPTFCEPQTLEELQYKLLEKGYRWLGHPGKTIDLKVARFLYVKYHPKHGRLLTMGQDTEVSARRFDASPMPEVSFETLLDLCGIQVP